MNYLLITVNDAELNLDHLIVVNHLPIRHSETNHSLKNLKMNMIQVMIDILNNNCWGVKDQ